MRRFLPLLGFLLLPACTFLPRPAPVPVPTETHEPEGKADELVILLPGRHSLPSEFRREGFLELVRGKHPSATIVAPDLHIGYYRNRSATERIHRDLVVPAREAGIRDVTLVGISMGGLGAVLYDLEHPGMAKSLVLLSPFLGDEEVIEDIRASSGLESWRPKGPEPDGFSRRVWIGLQKQWLNGHSRPDLLLGCGRSDRLAATSKLFQREFLNRGEAAWLAGDHNWPTWKCLYAELNRQPRVPETLEP
ncbi:esterase [Haloferula helveola]|uniref:Esterase n=1 Tax=Haloferula helveola TaxID=490095 RepID=A0ABM7RI73_9BACT|nr:esterase [Haloferula helveola]